MFLPEQVKGYQGEIQENQSYCKTAIKEEEEKSKQSDDDIYLRENGKMLWRGVSDMRNGKKQMCELVKEINGERVCVCVCVCVF